MCQLTFCRFQSLEQTKIFTTLSIISNTFISHHDGWGIYTGGRLFKTEMNAQLTSDIGTLVNDICKDKSPVISHVRLASIGSKVSNDNSHPFETENFVLAHNGTLTVKKDSEDDVNKIKKKHEKDEAIDSEVFAICLEDGYIKEKNFVALLKKTMNMFCGKFAFIIYCKPENVYYIIRGKTAELHCVNFYSGNKAVGFVVNTEKVSLDRTAQLFECSLQSVGVEISNSEIVELDKETIYKYSAYKAHKVGEIKENEKEVTPFFSHDRSYTTKRNSFGNSTYVSDRVFATTKSLIKFMKKYYLSLEDLDKIFYYTMNKGILTIEEEDLELFFEKITSKLGVSKKFVGDVEDILYPNKLQAIPFRFYTDNGFTFPYMTIKDMDTQMKFLEKLRKFAKEIYD